MRFALRWCNCRRKILEMGIMRHRQPQKSFARAKRFKKRIDQRGEKFYFELEEPSGILRRLQTQPARGLPEGRGTRRRFWLDLFLAGSIIVCGGTRQVDGHRHFRLFDIVFFTEGFPTGRYDLDKNYALGNLGRQRHALLIGLQVDLDRLALL
jgi:hypothetical protein